MAEKTISQSPLSEKELDRAYDLLNVVHWETSTRKSETRRVLEYLRDPIDKAKKAGASWTVIAAQIEAATKRKIAPSTIRSWYNKKPLTEKELEQGEKMGDSFDMSQPAPPAQDGN